MKKITTSLIGLAFVFSASAQDFTMKSTSKVPVIESQKEVLYETLPDPGGSGIVSVYSNTPDDLGVYSADDFNLATQADLTSVTAFGFNNGGNFLADFTGLDVYIYENSATNTPAGDPTQSGSGVLEIVDLDPTDPAITIETPTATGVTITLDLVAALGAPLNLSPGDYWITFAPRMDIPGFDGTLRWNHFSSGSEITGVGQTHLIDPGGAFGPGGENWRPLSALGIDQGGLALRIEGDRVGDFARVQVVHNAPDPSASEVDVYVNGDLAIDDFEFRTATEFLFLPAGVDLDLDVAPGSSADVSESLFTTTVNLLEDENYIVVADGVLDPSQFDDTVNTIAFNLEVFAGARREAVTTGNTDVLVHHGSPDAPTVDVVNQDGGGVLVDDISYPEFQGYLELPTDDYLIAVTTSDNSTVVAEYKAFLSDLGLEDQAVTIFASGFLDPSANQDGPAFGLWVSLASGGPLVELSGPTARAQVVHNSPDPSASVVDVYLGSDLLLDDFEFRTSTPFVDVPANQQITLSVAPGTSTDVSDALYSVDVTLVADETYVVVADGVLDPSQFDSSVNTIDFGLQVFGGGREAAVTTGNTDVLVHHGSPDAPIVDVVNQDGGAVIVDDISYPEFQGYLELPTDDYLIAVTTSDNSTVVAEYEAFLSELGLADQAITVLASGFLDPSANQDGPAFGLWVSLASGGPLVELSGPTARTQVIHNSPDPSASVVDVYLGDDLLLDDFEFRTSTPFVDVPANQQITLSVAPGTSSDVSEALYSVDVTLDFGETYIVVADGVLDPSQFDSSVNTIDFALQVFSGAREAATTAGNTDLLVHHGSPDAPTVDVVNQDGGGVLVDDISYPEFQGYLELPTDDYFIDVTTADNSVKVAGYQAFLSTLGLDDAAITVLASGFLDPSANQNGPAFGLWVSLAGGGPLVELLDENAFPAPYCGPLAFSFNVEPITNVEFAGIANRSSAVLGGISHEDFTALTPGEVTQGESYDIVLEGNTDGGFTNRFAVFIDWNQDEVFSGAEEVYEITQTISGSTGEDGQQAIQTLDVPVEAELGLTRMRVKKIFGTTDYLDPCVGASWGQAEDYTINVGTLSNDDFSSADFSFYPNPVKDILSISTQSPVDSLKVYNMLGQLVKEAAPKSSNPQISLSEINSGVYFVSMEVEGREQTFRVIKE